MSSTNKTPNYDLSQFVGTDKPSWLNDYNQDMSKIATAMKTNSDSATSANGKADANTTAIGDLSYLSTQSKTSVVSAVNEINAKAGTANETAANASTTANQAITQSTEALNELKHFNLTKHLVLTPSTNRGTIYSDVTNVQFASDESNSVFKIYGRVGVNNLSGQTGNVEVTIGQTLLRPSESYTIQTAGIIWRQNTAGGNATIPANITVNTNGTVTLNYNNLSGDITTLNIYLFPCLYFNSNFGDE